MCSWTKPHAPPRVCYTSDSFWYFGQNLDWFKPVKLSIETDQVGKTVGLHLVSPSVAFSQTLELPFNRAMKAELQWTACLCLKFWCWWGVRPLATLEWSWMVQGNGGGSRGIYWWWVRVCCCWSTIHFLIRTFAWNHVNMLHLPFGRLTC